MIELLSRLPRVVGAKETRRAIDAGRAKAVFLARDADPALTEPIAQKARAAGLATLSDFTMAQLGSACGIAVGASVAAALEGETPQGTA